jgi:hypothetical protein
MKNTVTHWNKFYRYAPIVIFKFVHKVFLNNSMSMLLGLVNIGLVHQLGNNFNGGNQVAH